MDKESFDKFLAWLDGDRKNAAAKHEECRHALIDFFQKKGCQPSDECADATIDRTVKILLLGKMGERKDPVSYLLKVAHFVRLEYLRNPASLVDQPVEWRHDGDDQTNDDDWLDQRRRECMEKCLQDLPPEHREIVTRYYEIRTAPEKAISKAKKLEQLAQLHHKSHNALRIEVHRMRSEKLKPCLETCFKNSINSR